MEPVDIKARLFSAQQSLTRREQIGIEFVDEDNTIQSEGIAHLRLAIKDPVQAQAEFPALIYAAGGNELFNYWMPRWYIQLLRWEMSWQSVLTSIATSTLPDVRDIARHIINVASAPEIELEDDEEDLEETIYFITLKIPGQDEIGCYVDWSTGQVAEWLMYQEVVEEPLAIYTTQHLIYQNGYPDVEIRIYRGLPGYINTIRAEMSFPTNNGTHYSNFDLATRWDVDFADECFAASDNRSIYSDDGETFKFLSPRYFVTNLKDEAELLSIDKSAVVHHLLMSLDTRTEYALLNLDDRYFIVSKILGTTIYEMTNEYMLGKFEKVKGVWVEPQNTIEFPFSHNETCYFEILKASTNLLNDAIESMETNKDAPRQTGKRPYHEHCLEALHELLKPLFVQEECHESD